MTEAQQYLFPIYQHVHHNAPLSPLLSMEECLLVEVQLPTLVPLATLWVAPLHVPVRAMERGVELHQHAVDYNALNYLIHLVELWR